MPDGQVLEFTRVTKRFNDVTAVSDLSARVEPGVVTAFLGPNGAGKTTSLRILLGQVRATSGTATIGGVAYPELRHPLRTIGAVLEETVYRPRRSAARQLTIAAKANGIPLSRVDEVLALVGLENEGDGRIGSFSLGMRQRLSVANALLGDPGALVFDEPANGLDPEGIRWMRLLMRRLADEGRTVLVSSHVLSEVEQVADHVLVLSKGRLVLSSGIETLADPAAGSVVVDAADRAALTAALATAGFDVEVLRSGLTVRGGDAVTVGAIAASAGVALSTLVQRGPTLEDVFIQLVRGGSFELGAGAAAEPIIAAPVTESDDVTDAAEAAPVGAIIADAGAGAIDGAGDVAQADAAESDAVDPQAGESDAVASEDAGDAVAAENAGEADADAPSADATEVAPSFDDILFGSGAGAATTSSDGDSVTTAAESNETDDAASDDEVDTDEEQDPRAAAVSTMLAEAARAYYEDEPKEYPLDETATDGNAATESASEGAHWAVAGTGVIDVVPSADAPQEEDASEQPEAHDAEAPAEGEHHEHHDGEHHEHHHG